MLDKEGWLNSRRRRWLTLVVSVWLECCGGASYGFGIYSEALKKKLGLNQQGLEMISFSKDLGECFGVVAGILYHATGPRRVLATGAVFNSIGYMLIWLALTGRLPWQPRLWELCIYMCVASNSQTFMVTTTLVTSVSSFPANRGLVIGLLKGCLGLSAALLTTTWHALGGGSSPATFVLLLAIGPTVLILLLSPMVSKPEADNIDGHYDARKFAWVCVPVCIVAALVMGTDLLQGSGLLSFGSTSQRAIGIAAFVVLFTSATSIFLNNKQDVLPQHRQPLLVEQNDTSPVISNEEKEEEKLSFLQSVTSVEFWLLLTATGLTLGSGFAAINNVGELGASMSYQTNTIHAMVSMLSVAQFIGRFGVGGAMADYLVTAWSFHRLSLLSFMSFFLCLGYVSLALWSHVEGVVFLACLVVGVCFGATYSLVPTVTSEVFGLCRFADMYNMVIMANPFVSYVLSVWVVAFFYERGGGGDGSSNCKGNGCFRGSFFVMCGISLVASVAYYGLFCLRSHQRGLLNRGWIS